jgi:hypothetical protein
MELNMLTQVESYQVLAMCLSKTGTKLHGNSPEDQSAEPPSYIGHHSSKGNVGIAGSSSNWAMSASEFRQFIFVPIESVDCLSVRHFFQKISRVRFFVEKKKIDVQKILISSEL